jgi:phage antirepressor YoqD-like protein
MEVLSITEIKTSFDLLCQIENKRALLVRSVAKSLKISELKLMSFINENPKLFHTDSMWSYKNVKVRNTMYGRNNSFVSTESVKNKNLGLGIHTVYLQASDNWRTDEWLVRMIAENTKYIHITESDNYGYIQGYYIAADEPGERRANIWRNNAEKIEFLRRNGYLLSGGFVYGGFGDSYTSKHDNIITINAINELKSRGWTFNDFKPMS